MLPREFPPWRTVYHYFLLWRLDGTWERLNATLCDREQVRQGRQAQQLHHGQPIGRDHQRGRPITPSGSLYRWVLPRLSAARLEWALASWIQATRPWPDQEAVALDGKVLRGASVREDSAPTYWP